MNTAAPLLPFSRLRLVCARMALACAAGCVLTGIGGCVVAPYGTAVPVAPSTYDRAFDAAFGAMQGQGLSISSQDRGAGVIVGSRGGLTLTASVRPQPDGTTRVEFNQSGNQAQDPNLVQRVVADYNRRMGR
jgi:hypothetical protein